MVAPDYGRAARPGRYVEGHPRQHQPSRHGPRRYLAIPPATWSASRNCA